jgi:hypothetical protein
MTDFQIADHGSIISIKPVSEAARTWVDDNVISEPWQWLGGALAPPWGGAGRSGGGHQNFLIESTVRNQIPYSRNSLRERNNELIVP